MNSFFILPLIGLGALIMFLSVCETRRIMRLLEGNRYRRDWRILQALMGFFLLGYAGAGVLVVMELSSWLPILMGVVFFCGALFVYLVVRSGYLSMTELLATKDAAYEARQARETAEAANRAKSEFLAMMSHEIRTPMNGVIGFGNLLEETELDEQQKDYVRTIITSGDSLLTIINDILDFSKLDAEKVDLEMRPIAIRHVIEDVLDLLAAGAHAKNLELLYWMAPDVPEGIMGDETRLRQTLLNLGSNAVKFTPHGSIEIAVELVDGAEQTAAPFRLPEGRLDSGQSQITFRVRDTGAGIPDDKINRLFLPFSQADTSVTRTHGGTGLGLAICKRLVALMGGEIGVSSQPGRGSDFHFTLPISPVDVTDQVQQRVALPAAEIDRTLQGRRALVVDDSEANRRLMIKLLTTHGMKPVAVDSAMAALRVLEREKFDIALLDYVMPQVDGIALAQKMRALPGNPCPVIMLVTSMTIAPENMPKDLFDAVTTKPVRNMQLLMMIARSVSGRTHESKAPKRAVNKVKLAAEFPLDILVAEDNPVNLKLITQILKSNGYTPITAPNGELALVALGERKFDLVLMDMIMPVLDGVTATVHLREGRAGELNQQTRVYALTANATTEDRERCERAGMDGFLSKPIHLADLIAALRQVGAESR